MPTDNVTKLLLGVIASALLYLCVVLTPVGTPVTAQTRMGDPAPVVLVGWEGKNGVLYRLTDGSGGLPTFDPGGHSFTVMRPPRGVPEQENKA